jgi:hypothetical protein
VRGLHDVGKRAKDVRNSGVERLHQPPTSVLAQYRGSVVDDLRVQGFSKLF